MSEGVGVNIDANRVIDRLGRRIAELEIQNAQQTAVIAALVEQKEEGMKDKPPGDEAE